MRTPRDRHARSKSIFRRGVPLCNSSGPHILAALAGEITIRAPNAKARAHNKILIVESPGPTSLPSPQGVSRAEADEARPVGLSWSNISKGVGVARSSLPSCTLSFIGWEFLPHQKTRRGVLPAAVSSILEWSGLREKSLGLKIPNLAERSNGEQGHAIVGQQSFDQSNYCHPLNARSLA